MPLRLTRGGLLAAVAELAQRDPDLARLVAQYGPPPLWARPPGFATLIHIVLEQQVSLASARAAYQRLVAATGRLTPHTLLALSDPELRAIGFSRQKAHYARELAQAVATGRLDLAGLSRLDDAAARAALQQIKGIGPWSADIYLLMALRRPDIWPAGDLALALAMQRALRLARLPDQAEQAALAERWRPWRAAAARVLWHFYLSARRPAAPAAS